MALPLTVQWMWGDAKLFSHNVARANPLRWSSKKSIIDTLTEFRNFGPEERIRPLDVKVREYNAAADKDVTILSLHLQNVDDAIVRLTDLETNYVRDGSVANGSNPITNLEETLRSRSESSEGPPLSFKSDSSLEGRRTNLAGMLEKRSRWRKEWEMRFFVMRYDRIDYYLSPPVIMDDEDITSRKGWIPLSNPVFASDENRPYCIGLGDTLLSCATRDEQIRWVETMRTAAARIIVSEAPAQASQPPSDVLQSAQLIALKASSLLLLPPDLNDAPKSVRWKEESEVLVPSRHATVPLLFVDGCLRAVCRMSLFDLHSSDCRSFPITWQSNVNSSRNASRSVVSQSDCVFRLCVTCRSNQLQPKATIGYMSWITLTCVAAIALLLGNCTRLASCALVVIAAASIFESSHLPDPPQRRVKFSIESIETDTLPAASTDTANDTAPVAPMDTAPSTPTVPQRWVGKWTLDKAVSQPYAPILADMGVHYLLRKSVDATTLTMDISTTASHVTIVEKAFIALEHCIPLDGSYITKPVPRGTKMSGNCRMKVVKHNENVLQLFTDFGDEHGTLNDLLTMNDDGHSFTRVISRGDLQVRRVFRRSRKP